VWASATLIELIRKSMATMWNCETQSVTADLARVSARMLTAARSLHVDAATAAVSEAFAVAGIRSVLLRGPSIERHLYGPGEVRSYVDADLLVEPGAFAHGEEVLAEHGFTHYGILGERSADRPAWSRTWSRSDGGTVDLHRTIVGIGVEDEEAWKTLGEHLQPVDVARERLDGLDPAATALVVALHAAQHGRHIRKPLDDLARALERVPDDAWQGAAALAERLAATPAFAAGLRLLPAGTDLARRLDLQETATAEVILRASTAPLMALGFEWLARTPGLRRKLVLIAGKLVPHPEFMRAWSPLARGGSRLGLALAYAWRPFWLLWHTAPGLRAWLAARRSAGR
jgi:hypothetical protein